jgi:ParB family chromosome partitioning protein
LSVDALDPNPWQPRRRFDDAALQELAANIKENGQLQPVVARPDPAKPGRFQIVMGERRWRAHRLLERTDLDVAIVEFSDVQMAIAALSENIQREDLTDFEVSQSLRVIQKEFPTRKDVAEAIGISRTQLHRLTAFQKLPGFVQDDLQAQPGLLGASAAGDVASALSRHGENGAALLLELWPALKAGQIEQGRLAQAIDARAAAGSGAAMRAGGHVRTFYRDGAKAGDIRRDARHFTVRLRNSYVDEELEKKIKEFMDGLFPAA